MRHPHARKRRKPKPNRRERRYRQSFWYKFKSASEDLGRAMAEVLNDTLLKRVEQEALFPKLLLSEATK